MRVFVAIITVNAALIGAVVLAYEFWPSFFEDEEAPYVCETLDNGADEPVEVCISREDTWASGGCRLEDDAATHGLVPPSALPPLLLVYDSDYDTYCAKDLPPEESE